MEKIICCFHEEDTPSMVLYEDHYKCFGCGAYGPLDKLPQTGRNTFKGSFKATDMPRMLQYIESLPKTIIRGLELPTDRNGFYLRYPNEDFYLYRWFKPPPKTGKYQYPKGHPLRLYWASKTDDKTLLLVEGQLNAESIKASNMVLNVASPGSCTELSKPKYLKDYLQYDKICIIVDEDAPGIAAALQLRETLLKHGKRVMVHAMPQDMNAVYVEKGPEAVKEEIRKLGL